MNEWTLILLRKPPIWPPESPDVLATMKHQLAANLAQNRNSGSLWMGPRLLDWWISQPQLGPSLAKRPLNLKHLAPNDKVDDPSSIDKHRVPDPGQSAMRTRGGADKG